MVPFLALAYHGAIVKSKKEVITMQIIVDVPNHFLDATHHTPSDFAQEAKLAMAAKLFEMKRLSSGMAANLIGMERVTFLAQLRRFGVPVLDLDAEELAQDILNA